MDKEEIGAEVKEGEETSVDKGNPNAGKEREDFGIKISDKFTGEKEFSFYFHKAKETGKMSRMFGKWNRRFMVLNLKDKDLYYTPKPGSGTKKALPLHVKTFLIKFFIDIFLKEDTQSEDRQKLF